MGPELAMASFAVLTVGIVGGLPILTILARRRAGRLEINRRERERLQNDRIV